VTSRAEYVGRLGVAGSGDHHQRSRQGVQRAAVPLGPL